MYPLYKDCYTRFEGEYPAQAIIDIPKNAKMIDFDLDGGSQFIRFYIGDGTLEKWWGDDWDDAPYEHNAGEVYSKFVSYVVDIAIPANAIALEPSDGELNSRWTKYDMEERNVCMILVTSHGDKWGVLPERFAEAQSPDDTMMIFMGDNAVDTILRLESDFRAQIMDVYAMCDQNSDNT